MLARRIAFLCIVLLTSTASIATVTESDIRRFVEAKPQAYSKTEVTDQILDILIANLPARGFDAAADQIAKRWQIDRRIAALLAEAELKAEISQWDRGQAARTTYEPMYLAALELDPGSAIVWEAYQTHLYNDGRCDTSGVAAKYFSQPGAAMRFLQGSQTHCAEWIQALPGPHAGTPLAYWRWAELLRYEDPFGRIAASELLLEQLRLAGLPVDSAEMISAMRFHLDALASAGLQSRFLATADALDGTLRSRTFDPTYSPSASLDGEDIGYQQTLHLRNQWILVLAQSKRRTEAWARFGTQKLNKRVDRSLSPERTVFGDSALDEIEFVRNFVQPRPDIDYFDLFLGKGNVGLLWSVGRQDPVFEHAFVTFFIRNGYETLGQSVLKELCETRATEVTQKSRYTLTPALWAARARYVAAFKDEWFSSGVCKETGAEHVLTIVARVNADYVEKAVPEDLRTARTSEKEPSAPKSSCIDHVAVIRCDTSGDRWAAISLSNDVDPTGEIGAGGYWLHLSKDRGATWDHPIYLGLQQMQPYVVPATSRLPILKGDSVQLEVLIRELDPESISFPPVALATKREGSDIYIERSLSELVRDSDGDALTDLLEDKLRTDSHNADTDGDGLDDSIDTLPQISHRAPPHADAPVIVKILEHIFGYDAGAIRLGLDRGDALDPLSTVLGTRGKPARVLFLEADKEAFAGLLPPSPFIVLDAKDLQYLNARFGIHYPIQLPVPWFNKQHTKAVVRWSAGWTGGTLYFEKAPTGKWKVEETERWIT